MTHGKLGGSSKGSPRGVRSCGKVDRTAASTLGGSASLESFTVGREGFRVCVGNGKLLQYCCLENHRNSMKRQKDRTLKVELPGR